MAWQRMIASSCKSDCDVAKKVTLMGLMSDNRISTWAEVREWQASPWISAGLALLAVPV